GDQGECWQNTTTLAKGAQLGRGTIASAKKELIRAGLIAVVSKGQRYHDNDRIRILNIWDANMREFTSFSCSCDEQPSHELTPNESTPTSAVVHQVSAVVHQVNNGCSSHERGCSPHELEEDLFRRRSPKEEICASQVKSDKAYSPGFERFWQAYPVKKG